LFLVRKVYGFLEDDNKIMTSIGETMPQGDEIWLFLVRKVYGYLEDDNKVMTRPYLLMLYEISPSSNLLYAEMLVENLGKFPGAKRVQKILEDTIKTPNEDKKQPAHRPKGVIFTSEKLFKNLKEFLEEQCKVKAQLWTEQENQGYGDEYVKLYSNKLREKQKLSYNSSALKPGILSILKTKERGETFFKTCSAFYKSGAKQLFETDTFIITWPEAGTRLMYFYPNKDEIRIGFETSPAEMSTLFQTGMRATIDENTPGAYHRALFFTDEFSAPFNDLYDIDKYRYELATKPSKEHCIPFPIAFYKEMTGFFRPPIIDLDWFEVCLWALMKFADDWKSKKITAETAVSVAYTVPIYNRNTEVKITLYHPKKKNFEGLEELWEKVHVPEQKESMKPDVVIGTEHDPNACRVCKIIPKSLKSCGVCKRKLYCSVECQKKDWPIHKKICSKPVVTKQEDQKPKVEEIPEEKSKVEEIPEKKE